MPFNVRRANKGRIGLPTDNGATHGGHVGRTVAVGGLAAAFGIAYLMPDRRRIVVTFFLYAILVALATVYGRYHYAVDAAGGFIVGVFAFPLGAWLVSVAARRRRAAAGGAPWSRRTIA